MSSEISFQIYFKNIEYVYELNQGYLRALALWTVDYIFIYLSNIS